ncbi:MAG: ABC transporter permease [Cyclobacteriaceae bacterium]
MIRNLFLVSIRNLKKQRFYSILNIAGLGTALGVFLLLWLYIEKELSYDTFHKDADRLYRVDQTFIWGDAYERFGSTGPAVAPAIRANVPGIEAVTHVMTPNTSLVSVDKAGQKMSFEEMYLLAADSSFFDIFQFDFLSGNRSSALQLPNSVVISESIANKYFDSTDGLGRVLEITNGEATQTYRVTGVMKDLPSNMHFRAEIITSTNSYENISRMQWSWIWSGFVTYVKLLPDANVQQVEQRLFELPSFEAEASLMRVYGQTFEEYTASGKDWNLFMMPIQDIWLKSAFSPNRLGPVGDIQYVYLFAVVGILILTLACVNYTNMATARYAGRLREVGVRKSLGANKQTLMMQFMIESLILSTMGVLLAIGLAEISLPYFNYTFENDLALSILDKPYLIIVLSGMALTTGVLSGIYPSWMISKIGAVKALKGKLETTRSGLQVKNVLVISQFAISIGLVILSILVYRQLNFLQSKSLGFDENNLIVISQTQRLGQKQGSFLEELKTIPVVKSASSSDSAPPAVWNSDHFTSHDTEIGETPLSYIVGDEDYLEALGVELVQGRFFGKDYGAEAENVIINEKAAEALGWDTSGDLLNKKVVYTPSETRFNVVGVMKDFHFSSLNSPIEPLVIFTYGARIYTRDVNYISIRLASSVNGQQLTSLLEEVEEKWKQADTSLPFRYRFTDEAFFADFESEKRLGQLLNFFTILAIMIAGLGLFGLASFTAEKRAKEIGIRKVLGANVSQLVMMLSRDFTKLAFYAMLIAGPLAWFVGNEWLADFEYRTDFSWDIFMIAAGLGILTAFLAVLYQSIKSATSNPVNVLKDE